MKFLLVVSIFYLSHAHASTICGKIDSFSNVKGEDMVTVNLQNPTYRHEDGSLYEYGSFPRLQLTGRALDLALASIGKNLKFCVQSTSIPASRKIITSYSLE